MFLRGCCRLAWRFCLFWLGLALAGWNRIVCWATLMGYKEFGKPLARSLNLALTLEYWAGRRVTVLIEDWQRCRHSSAR